MPRYGRYEKYRVYTFATFVAEKDDSTTNPAWQYPLRVEWEVDGFMLTTNLLSGFDWQIPWENRKDFPAGICQYWQMSAEQGRQWLQGLVPTATVVGTVGPRGILKRVRPGTETPVSRAKAALAAAEAAAKAEQTERYKAACAAAQAAEESLSSEFYSRLEPGVRLGGYHHGSIVTQVEGYGPEGQVTLLKGQEIVTIEAKWLLSGGILD